MINNVSLDLTSWRLFVSVVSFLRLALSPGGEAPNLERFEAGATNGTLKTPKNSRGLEELPSLESHEMEQTLVVEEICLSRRHFPLPC